MELQLLVHPGITQLYIFNVITIIIYNHTVLKASLLRNGLE